MAVYIFIHAYALPPVIKRDWEIPELNGGVNVKIIELLITGR
jgi:hypothetical protein